MATSLCAHRVRIRLSAITGGILLFSFSCAVFPVQASERDRFVDSLAGSLIIDKASAGMSEADMMRYSILHYLNSGKVIEARGIAVRLVEHLDETPAATSAEKREASELLSSADIAVAEASVESLYRKAEELQAQGIFISDLIGYRYEVLTRIKRYDDQVAAEHDLCNAFASYSETVDLNEFPQIAGRALNHCGRVFDAMASDEYFGADRLRPLFDILSKLWTQAGRPAEEFPYTAKLLTHLTPREIENELQNILLVVSIAQTAKPGDTQIADSLIIVAFHRYLLAERLGNSKEMGLALLSYGGHQERRGDLQNAQRSYAKARALLEEIGYLEMFPPVASMLRSNLEFDIPGGPEAAAHSRIEAAKKAGDLRALASAREDLSTILSRQHRNEEAKLLIVENLATGTKANDKLVIAHAQWQLAKSNYIDPEGKVSPDDRMTVAAELYTELGYKPGEAEAALFRWTSNIPADEHFERALSLAKETGNLRLQALHHQMRANKFINARDADGSRKEGRACRDLYDQMGAREQVAHCEVLLVEAESQAGNRRAACRHLKTAHGIFTDLGMPGRTAMQEEKAKKLGCGRL